jgi:hypothetical protein
MLSVIMSGANAVRERGKPEDHQVELIRETPPIAVADEPGDKGTYGQAEERQ